MRVSDTLRQALHAWWHGRWAALIFGIGALCSAGTVAALWEYGPEEFDPMQLAVWFLWQLVLAWILAGTLQTALYVLEHGPTPFVQLFREMFTGPQRFARFWLVGVAVAVAAGFGLWFWVVPGLFVLLFFGFAPLVVLDFDGVGLHAFRTAAGMSKRHLRYLGTLGAVLLALAVAIPIVAREVESRAIYHAARSDRLARQISDKLRREEPKVSGSQAVRSPNGTTDEADAESMSTPQGSEEAWERSSLWYPRPWDLAQAFLVLLCGFAVTYVPFVWATSYTLLRAADFDFPARFRRPTSGGASTQPVTEEPSSAADGEEASTPTAAEAAPAPEAASSSPPPPLPQEG